MQKFTTCPVCAHKKLYNLGIRGGHWLSCAKCAANWNENKRLFEATPKLAFDYIVKSWQDYKKGNYVKASHVGNPVNITLELDDKGSNTHFIFPDRLLKILNWTKFTRGNINVK